MELMTNDQTGTDVACHKAAEKGYEAQQLYVLVNHATGHGIDSLPASVQRCVEPLARTGAILGLREVSLPAYSAELSKLSHDKLRIQLRLIKLKKAEEELRTAIYLARHRRRTVTLWNNALDDTENDTASLERQKKLMTAKAKEYQQELHTIPSKNLTEQSDRTPSITSLLALQENVRHKERSVKAKKARLKTFENLPPNLELAKLELARARENQIRLMNARDKLMRVMTQGLS